MAIAATIQAAEIQASATKIAAIYGGLALGVGVFASWLTSLHLQKVARLAESRKVVYLELVEAYSEMIAGFHLLRTNLGKHWETQAALIVKFSKIVDKAVFICETNTKKEIFTFLDNFVAKVEIIQAEVTPLIIKKTEVDSLFNQHSRVMEHFNNAVNEMEKIKMNGDGEDRLPKISKYFDEKLVQGSNYLNEMREIEAEIKIKSKTIEPLLIELLNESNANTITIVHLLRKELGAKTDHELDKFLQSKVNIDVDTY